MTSRQIRQQFIDFFKARGHTTVPSSPVVPFDDPTLLFANAGMNQFRPIFLGQRAADVDRWSGVTPGLPTRAANSQKCIRAGGKHNDLDDVGKDTYHHTFFEMLGNWSFGDYFKKEAIAWAWELLTRVWGIPKERLHATYFGGSGPGSRGPGLGLEAERASVDATRSPKPETRDPSASLPPDLESRDLWLSVTDIDPAHVHPGSMKDNFWEMGDTGPCGPCSEIHIDLTPECSGGPLVNAGDARVMEIWNLVFIQFNRGADGSLTPLPARHVDTGMGFERICSVLQGMAADRLGRFSNYDTDVFAPIFEAIRKRTGAPAYRGTLPEPQASAGANPPSDERLEPPTTSGNPERLPAPEGSRGLKPAARDQIMIDVSYRVIADHLRALTFALTDGAVPSNEGRGYVLRRILRRAVRFGRQYLNMHEPFICDLVEPLVAHMADAFPELRTAHGGRNLHHVAELIRDEESSFLKTLDRGMKLFDEAAQRARESRTWVRAAVPPTEGVVELEPPRGQKPAARISGEDAFKLHDTYGFPIDLTQQMAEECGLGVDIAGYERLMEEARRLARAGGRDLADPFEKATYELLPEGASCDDSLKYIEPFECATFVISVAPDPAGEGEAVVFSTNRTPFYAEQGGQVSDVGVLETDEGDEVQIVDVARRGEHILHRGIVSRGRLSGGLRGWLRVDAARRTAIMQNHTATHLLNWALREALCPPEERVNPHVQQKGSLVDADKTRFDFSHPRPLSEEDIERIEDYVAMQIRANHKVYAEVVDQQAARKINTLRAVFGEKYPERVRVVSIGAPIAARPQAPDAPTDTGPPIRTPHASEGPMPSTPAPASSQTRASKLETRERTFPLTPSEGVEGTVPNGVEEGEARMAAEGGAAALQLEETIHTDTLLASPTDPKWMQYSVEFCGGTHVAATGQIEDFVLVAEEAVAKGIRRVVGVTAQAARDARSRAQTLRDKVAALWDARDAELPARLADAQKEFAEAQIPVLARHKIREQLDQLAERARKVEKQKAAASGSAVLDRVAELLTNVRTPHASEGPFSGGWATMAGDVTVIVAEVPPASPDALRSAVDWIRQKTPASAVLLACISDGKVTLLAGMSKSVVDRGIKAGDLIREISARVGGKGGGRPDLAQGGGTNPAALGDALSAANNWIVSKLV